ncbi:hypothetical protein K2173_003908 [Erythroxylum novogranatense]|uniref:Uncharacterized protein n=1 Tax=Erythroxylum novogranatense TaxID=1862640 RepID=A0AAV8SJ27_9ROSI|nr:hypothetical protein K2173_003908 [Erythroxylum novogranatense]
MYRTLKESYWWPGMKREIVEFVARYLPCQQITAEHQKLAGMLQSLPIPEWKWEQATMDFVVGLSRTSKGHDAIWTNGQSERTIQMLEDMMRARVMEFQGSWDRHLPLIEFAYNNSYHKSIGMPPYEALYGRKCRTPLCWDEIGTAKIEGAELIECLGIVAYRLELPLDLDRIHNVFHVSILKKYLPDPSHVLEAPPVELREDLSFEVKPVQILDRQIKKLRSKEVPTVKVLWKNDKVEEMTWELEDNIRRQHPHLFVSLT